VSILGIVLIFDWQFITCKGRVFGRNSTRLNWLRLANLFRKGGVVATLTWGSAAMARSRVEKMRCAVFLKRLKLSLGMGFAEIHQAVNAGYYDLEGVDGPSEDTVDSYFKGKHTPEIDPPNAYVLSWVMAVEKLFANSTDVLFHALWNLLGYRLISGETSLKRLSIEGDTAKIESRFERSAGRTAPNELSRVRHCMLQLPSEFQHRLFVSDMWPFSLARRSQSIEVELAGWGGASPIDVAALALALLLEAFELEDAGRAESARNFLLAHMPTLLAEPGFSDVGKELSSMLADICERTTVRCFNFLEANMDGYPESWATHVNEKLVRDLTRNSRCEGSAAEVEAPVCCDRLTACVYVEILGMEAMRDNPSAYQPLKQWNEYSVEKGAFGKLGSIVMPPGWKLVPV
jgi:hypothetical protein